MAIYKVQTSLRFEEENYRKMVLIAKHNHRSLNAQMEFLAQNCIEQYEKEYGPIILPEEE